MQPQSTGAVSPTHPTDGGPLPTIGDGGRPSEVATTLAPDESTSAGGPMATSEATGPIAATGTFAPAGSGTINDAGLQPLLRSRLIFVGTVALAGWSAYALGLVGSILGRV